MRALTTKTAVYPATAISPSRPARGSAAPTRRRSGTASPWAQRRGHT